MQNCEDEPTHPDIFDEIRCLSHSRCVYNVRHLTIDIQSRKTTNATGRFGHLGGNLVDQRPHSDSKPPVKTIAATALRALRPMALTLEVCLSPLRFKQTLLVQLKGKQVKNLPRVEQVCNLLVTANHRQARRLHYVVRSQPAACQLFSLTTW